MPPHPRLTDDRRVLSSDEEALVSDLVAIAYPDLATAREVASNVGQAQKAHIIDLEDLVIVERRHDGKVKLHHPSMASVGAAAAAPGGGRHGLTVLGPLPRRGAGAGGPRGPGRIDRPGLPAH